jgi:hypothetical protein
MMSMWKLYNQLLIVYDVYVKTLQPIINSVWCLCENDILYKYQITLIAVFNSFLVSSEILKLG